MSDKTVEPINYIPPGFDNWQFVASDEAKMCLFCTKKASKCKGTCKFKKKGKKK